MTTYAIEVEDMTVAYLNKPVLWDVDIRIPQQQITAIIGPNGAGKSTFMKAVLGLVRPLSGTVLFQGGSYRQMYKKIGYVPQKEAVNWDFPTTVLDVVLMGRYSALGWFKRVSKQDRILALSALAELQMEDYALRQISELSGGQQQRVFLARALVQDAEIYLLDEPFAGIDKTTELQIIYILRQLKQRGKTILVVHHDLNTISEYFDYVVMINKVVMAQGPVATTFTQSNRQQTFFRTKEEQL